MRTLLGLGFMMVLACGTSVAEEKIDGKKLIGKWEQTADKDKMRPKIVAEFTADGKVHATVGETPMEGTYKLVGSKLTLTVKHDDKEESMKVTIFKLTDDILEGEDEKGQKSSFKKLKAVKKSD